MANKSTALTIQKWGNSLALRIPSMMAKRAHVQAGSLVEICLQEGNIIVKPSGHTNLSLEQKLAAFDPKKHGGEIY